MGKIKFDELEIGDVVITVSYYNEREVGIIVGKTTNSAGKKVSLAKRVDIQGLPCNGVNDVYVERTKEDGGEAFQEVAAIVGHIEL